VSRLKIPDTILKTIQNIMPLILAYIFMEVMGNLVTKAGIGKKIKGLLPQDPWENAKYFFLLGLFVLFFVLNLFVSGIAKALIKPIVSLLRPISKSVLLYGIIVMVMARMLGETWSPSNGILQSSLQVNKITYKKYLKKTWFLGVIMFLASLLLIGLWTYFVVK